MKIAYRREMKHNYLIIEPENREYDSYEMYMLAANKIEGLLKFHVKQVDGQKSYYYEITSKQPLSRILEHSSMGGRELKSLIGGIAQILGRLECFLLSENQILMDSEYIYVDPERFTVFLCMVPGAEGDFPAGVTGLLQYLLGKIDHQDKECVVMAYGLYQESLKENYGMKDLLEIIGKREEMQQRPETGEEEQEEINQRYTETFRPEEERRTEKKILPPSFSPALSADSQENRTETKAGSAAALILIFAGVSGCGLGALWLALGNYGIAAYWYGPLAAAIVIAGLKLGWHSKEKGVQKEQSFDENRTAWQVSFEEEEPMPEPERKEDKDTLRTVLLTNTSEDQEVHYLRGTAQETEDIKVSYVPFLIGKQEGLVDYVLDRQTVSRIHVRIDCEEGEYRLTDLNSTNGTSVNGRHLETNETVMLKEGDEVLIANFAYIFT